MKKIPFTLNGVVYESQRAASKALGLHPNSLSQRKTRGTGYIPLGAPKRRKMPKDDLALMRKERARLAARTRKVLEEMRDEGAK